MSSFTYTVEELEHLDSLREECWHNPSWDPTYWRHLAECNGVDRRPSEWFIEQAESLECGMYPGEHL